VEKTVDANEHAGVASERFTIHHCGITIPPEGRAIKRSRAQQNNAGGGRLFVSRKVDAKSAYERKLEIIENMHQVHLSSARFIVRRHQGNGRVREVGPWRRIAESETGKIEERSVVIEDGFGGELEARSIRVRLPKQTRDGDREIELLTDLPAKITAELIADAYRQRWRIETAFADLDRVFEGEIESLGHPPAALLAFALALVAYNTLGVVQAALRVGHGAETVKNAVSPYYLGLSTATSWSSLELFHDATDWTQHFARTTAYRPLTLESEHRIIVGLPWARRLFNR
jgi:hypothetical protein